MICMLTSLGVPLYHKPKDNIMKRISQQQLQVLLRDIKGAQPATIVAVTTPTMTKTDNPYMGRVNKMQMTNIFINFIYENSVNRQRLREDETPDFVAHPRKWGQRITGTPLVEHKGKFYLEAKVEKVFDSVYYIDGAQADTKLLTPFLPTKHSNADHQGVEKEIIVRDYSLDNIREIKMLGEHYIIF